MPGGMIAGNDTLPRMSNWTNWKNAYVHAFHDSYWGNWMYQLQDINATDGTIAFSKGGFQEARGSGKGDYLYFENKNFIIPRYTGILSYFAISRDLLFLMTIIY